MWRALAVARGDLVIYLDPDTRHFSAHFLTGMLGPLLCHPEVRQGQLHAPVLGRRRRAAARRWPRDGADGATAPVGLYPELGAFAQPLAGEGCAARAA